MTEPRQKPGRSKQDYGTPPEFLAAVKARLGIQCFDCDLAASNENAVAEDYISSSRNAFLAENWKFGDGWNWLNPPFTSIGVWAHRAYLEVGDGARTAMLIPAAVGSNWWRDNVHRKADVLFLNPRLTFVGCQDPYPKDCALLLYSPGSAYRHGSYDVWTWKQGKAVGAVVGSVDEGTPDPSRKEHLDSSPDEATA